MFYYPHEGVSIIFTTRSAKRAEDERKRPERLRRWNKLRAELGYERTDALLGGAPPEDDKEREFTELVSLARKKKIW